MIPLSDGASEVIETGPGVTKFKVGDRVAGNFFQRWGGGEPAADVHKSALGGGIDGVLADYAVLEEDGAVKIPAHIAGGGRDTAMRRSDGLERDDGTRQTQGRRHDPAARYRRGLDFRVANCSRYGDSGHHHVVERR